MSLVGRTLGQYKIIEELGRGGMATVYKAQDNTGRELAIKVPKPEIAKDQDFLARFRQEIQVTDHLEGLPHIIPIYDSNGNTDPPFIVMPFMKTTLEDKLAAGPLALEELSQIITQIAQAIDGAHHHKEKIIHRDIKPSNILFDQDGQVFLADFGIAKMIEGTDYITTQTALGIPGAPAYMSPEQVKGVKHLDHRTDIYSLGIVVFKCLTGQVPYEGTNPFNTANAHILQPIPKLKNCGRDLPRAYQKFIDKAMAKEPRDRFDSAGELAEAFRRLVFPDIGKPDKKSDWHFWPAIAAVVLLLVCGIWLIIISLSPDGGDLGGTVAPSTAVAAATQTPANGTDPDPDSPPPAVILKEPVDGLSLAGSTDVTLAWEWPGEAETGIEWDFRVLVRNETGETVKDERGTVTKVSYSDLPPGDYTWLISTLKTQEDGDEQEIARSKVGRFSITSPSPAPTFTPTRRPSPTRRPAPTRTPTPDPPSTVQTCPITIIGPADQITFTSKDEVRLEWSSGPLRAGDRYRISFRDADNRELEALSIRNNFSIKPSGSPAWINQNGEWLAHIRENANFRWAVGVERGDEVICETDARAFNWRL